MLCIEVECRFLGSGSLRVGYWDKALVFTFGAWCPKRDGGEPPQAGGGSGECVCRISDRRNHECTLAQS